MKREHLVKPNPSCLGDFPESSEKLMVEAQANTQAPNLEGQRRVKTSAAMIGLAISMGATGMLLPQRDNQAFAAESAQTEHTVTLPPVAFERTGKAGGAEVSYTASEITETRVVAPAPPAIKHEIAKGDTLWQLAENYQVETYAIAVSNNISPNTPLPVGKSLKIPVTPQPSEPNLDNASVVLQVPASKPASKAQDPKVSTIAVEATKEVQGAIEEKTPVVIPVSTPEPLPNQRASEVPTIRVAASPQSGRSENLAPGTSSTPAVTAAENSTKLSQPQVAASPNAPEKIEANPDEAAVVVPVSTLEEDAENRLDEVVPTQELIEPQTPEDATALDAATDPRRTYQVQPGDTLDSIARRHNISRTELAQANHLSDPNLIKVDQQLWIPATGGEQETSFAISQPRLVADNVPRITIDAQIESPTERSLDQLRADIEKLQQNYGQEADSDPTSNPDAVQITVTPVFSEDSSRKSDWEAARNEVPIKVESFQPTPRPTETAQPTAPETRESEGNLVASAPISVEAYNPMLQTPVGEMVAPEAPPLSPPEEYLPDSPERFDGYIWPAKGVLTSGYGWRWGRMHKGVDIAAPIGTPIVAAAPGEVISAGWNSGGYGNLVKVKHDDGSVTLYAHNNRILVRRGQKVDQGQQIAEMGSTGYSTGPHLHFEVHPGGGAAQNPMAFLPKR